MQPKMTGKAAKAGKAPKTSLRETRRLARGRNVKPSVSVVYKYWEEMFFCHQCHSLC